MIKLIVGLGNPGKNYEKTRHNAGFLFLDELVQEFGGSWVVESKFEGIIAEPVISSNRVMLLKPTTFMNGSGRAVAKVARYYKLSPEEVLVVHDELDFNAGVLKLKKGGGHAGHNGLRDIISHLDSKDFYRLRVGIGRPSAGKVVADYVLSSPSKTEMSEIVSVLSSSLLYVPKMLTSDMSVVMNVLNS